MRQQIGLELTKHNPISLIISNRLAVLQQTYGSMRLMGSIIRIQRGDSSLKILSMLDVHMSNLVLTYGLNTVISLYKTIYQLPKAS